MFVDEDLSHIAKGSILLAERIGIELLWLPKRSPKLNPTAELWGQTKDEICSNWQYESIEVQEQAFLDYLRGMSDRQALLTSGVLSGELWLTR